MELSVSILNAKDKKEMINILNNTDISYIHMDVMDGKFVSQVSLPSYELRELAKYSNKEFDVHLMVDDPLTYIEEIKNIENIKQVTIHLEIDKDIDSILSKIKEYDFKVGLAIKPNTYINKLIPYLEYIDTLLIMSVEPGYGGQPFIDSTPNRIKKIKELTKDYNISLEVDGGINNETIKKIIPADIAVVGSYITNSTDPITTINDLIK